MLEIRQNVIPITAPMARDVKSFRPRRVGLPAISPGPSPRAVLNIRRFSRKLGPALRGASFFQRVIGSFCPTSKRLGAPRLGGLVASHLFLKSRFAAILMSSSGV